MSVLIVLCIVLTAVGGGSIYYGEQSTSVCNTQQPVSPLESWAPLVGRGDVRDYEGTEDNGEDDPMIFEEVEPERRKSHRIRNMMALAHQEGWADDSICA
ncbi:hypothetical protein JD844_020740 [Phrynosoma platyrhinos]|uniref:MHC class I antigen n=1 Tax=Phrynosoma platyrhinos TaxID=52577 RepID=A0ABQ7STJ9_PHRPL|nr:hypothetical protein JD844_020740 [Phrynosoma platyrhinos]